MVDFEKILVIITQNFAYDIASTHFHCTEDGLVNVDGSVEYEPLMSYDKLPVRFGTVSRGFDCDSRALQHLEGSPISVLLFKCQSNLIKSLIGGPNTASTYDARFNNLTALEGLPEICNDIRLSWSDHLPLLRLLSIVPLEEMIPTVFLTSVGSGPTKASTIIQGYLNLIHSAHQLNKKSAIWKCQNELIEHGFEGNAKW
jgi:hypothetical protein